MNDEHIVVLVVGKTCAGKSSLIRKVCERTGATQLLSYTTRPKRNEQDIDHTFIDEETYFAEKSIGNIVAETEISGYHYFSTFDQLQAASFYTVDPNGVKMLKSMNLPNIKFVVIYIKADDNEREHRAISIRGDDKLVYRKRCISEAQQFREFIRDEAYDYVITNNDFATAYSVLRWISIAEGAIMNGEEE